MSENQNRGIQDFSKYDTMETEELEEILRLDAETPEGEESDTELILYVMEVLARRRNNANITGNNAQTAWESFQQNYMPKACLEYTPAKKDKNATTQWWRRMVAAAAVIALVVCVPVTANAFSWDEVWGVFAQWAKETFSFVSGEDTEISEPSPNRREEVAPLQELLAESKRNASIVPTWIPDGYELESVEKSQTPVQEIYWAFYLNGDKVLRIRVQTFLSTEFQKSEINTDYSEIYLASGIEYYLFENMDQCRAVWIADTYECNISGDLSIEEIKLMIDSIGKG